MSNIANDKIHKYCKDYYEWPDRWKMWPEDVAYGKELLQVFRPFLLYLVQQGLSRKTINKHIDNIWLLGGEIIRRLDYDESLREVEPAKLVADSVDDEGGPLCHYLTSESEQNSFDSTCRKLNKFLKNR